MELSDVSERPNGKRNQNLGNADYRDAAGNHQV